MTANGSSLLVERLPSKKLLALKRRAQHAGMTPEAYVRQLIEDDLKLEREALQTPFEKLAAPFEKALGGMSDDEIDELAESVRARRHKKSKKH